MIAIRRDLSRKLKSSAVLKLVARLLTKDVDGFTFFAEDICVRSTGNVFLILVGIVNVVEGAYCAPAFTHLLDVDTGGLVLNVLVSFNLVSETC